MKLMRKFSMTILLGVVAMSLYGCSSQTNQYSPDQVIQNALEESTPAYYAELEMIVSDKGETTVEIMKEWRSSDGKIRTESQNLDGNYQIISANNGSILTLYEVDQNKAYIIDDEEILSFNKPSLKDQANMLLEMVRDTHEISTKDEEKVVGRDTHHLFAKAKKNDTLFGDLELWIDKENWLVLKSIFNVGNTVTETTYTKIDFNAKIPSDLFTIDLPADVEVVNTNDMLETEEISLEEIPVKIGKPVLHFPETEELQISLIEIYELQGELDRNELSLDYTRDGLPLLILSVFETVNEVVDDTGEESVKIRNQEGSYTELGDFRSVLWEENGLTYSIVFIDPNLTLEEFIEMTGKMELIQ